MDLSDWVPKSKSMNKYSKSKSLCMHPDYALIFNSVTWDFKSFMPRDDETLKEAEK